MKSSIMILEDIVARRLGETPDKIRNSSLSYLRKRIEAKHKNKPMTLISRFPFIGRGNVLGDRILSQKQIERDLDNAFKKTRNF